MIHGSSRLATRIDGKGRGAIGRGRERLQIGLRVRDDPRPPAPRAAHRPPASHRAGASVPPTRRRRDSQGCARPGSPAPGPNGSPGRAWSPRRCDAGYSTYRVRHGRYPAERSPQRLRQCGGPEPPRPGTVRMVGWAGSWGEKLPDRTLSFIRGEAWPREALGDARRPRLPSPKHIPTIKIGNSNRDQLRRYRDGPKRRIISVAKVAGFIVPLTPIGAGCAAATRLGRGEGMAKLRADQMLLVDRGLVERRTRAQALIMAGLVFAGDRKIEKPGQQLAEEVRARRTRARSSPGSRAAGSSWRTGSIISGGDVTGARRDRCGLLHRRLHRCAAHARRSAALRGGQRHQPAGLEAAPLLFP